MASPRTTKKYTHDVVAVLTSRTAMIAPLPWLDLMSGRGLVKVPRRLALARRPGCAKARADLDVRLLSAVLLS